MKAYPICSGGLDSVSLAYHLYNKHALSGILTFNYGQKHKKKTELAKRCANHLGVPFHLLDLSAISEAMKGSALTNDIVVPDGHYTKETMKITVVPNRNAIFFEHSLGFITSG